MSNLVLVAGDFGRGAASYRDGEFRLPGKRLQSAVNVGSVEANRTITERHWGRAFSNGVRNAATLAPAAMVVGIFAAPLATVGTIGIAAAAVGAAIGLLGGGAKTKALVQVAFDQGTGFVAVCERRLAETIAHDARVMRAEAMRQQQRLEPPRRPRPFGAAVPQATPVSPSAPIAHLPAPSTTRDDRLINGLAVAVGTAAASLASDAGEAVFGIWGSALKGVVLRRDDEEG